MLIRRHTVPPRQYLPPLSNYSGQIRRNGTRVFRIKVAADWGGAGRKRTSAHGGRPGRPDCGRDTLWVLSQAGGEAAAVCDCIRLVHSGGMTNEESSALQHVVHLLQR